MKFTIQINFLILILLLLVSCNNSKFESISENEKKSLMELGDSISTEMQTVLMKNVSDAIKKGGTEFAIEFCNLEAMSLTDSISQNHKVSIQRMSNKNRNPKNAIQTDYDVLAWEKLEKEKSDFLEQTETGEIYYYKPISIGMPTCLQCHGKPEDISAKTLELINLKYPNDSAVDYEMGDLRGMWKIKI